MSLFSKLFKDKDTENAAKDLLKGLFQANSSQPQHPSGTAQQNSCQPQNDYPPQNSFRPEPKPAPSGFSWGEEMPAEENQYSFNGTYLEYFDTIFREEFPAYAVEHSAGYGGRTTVFTLSAAGRTALVVELVSEISEPKKLRENCAQKRIPYLRFYYDHHGWWNTRSYVITRTRGALGL